MEKKKREDSPKISPETVSLLNKFSEIFETKAKGYKENLSLKESELKEIKNYASIVVLIYWWEYLKDQNKNIEDSDLQEAIEEAFKDLLEYQQEIEARRKRIEEMGEEVKKKIEEGYLPLEFPMPEITGEEKESAEKIAEKIYKYAQLGWAKIHFSISLLQHLGERTGIKAEEMLKDLPQFLQDYFKKCEEEIKRIKKGI